MNDRSCCRLRPEYLNHVWSYGFTKQHEAITVLGASGYTVQTPLSKQTVNRSCIKTQTEPLTGGRSHPPSFTLATTFRQRAHGLLSPRPSGPDIFRQFGQSYRRWGFGLNAFWAYGVHQTNENKSQPCAEMLGASDSLPASNRSAISLKCSAICRLPMILVSNPTPTVRSSSPTHAEEIPLSSNCSTNRSRCSRTTAVSGIVPSFLKACSPKPRGEGSARLGRSETWRKTGLSVSTSSVFRQVLADKLSSGYSHVSAPQLGPLWGMSFDEARRIAIKVAKRLGPLVSGTREMRRATPIEAVMADHSLPAAE